MHFLTQVNISEWEDWALTVKYDPRPVKMRLVPIHYLLADSHPTKPALVAATDDYLARNEQVYSSKIMPYMLFFLNIIFN
jgi:hypothetical protein